MGISPSSDTTDKFISNIRKKSLGTKLTFLEVHSLILTKLISYRVALEKAPYNT